MICPECKAEGKKSRVTPGPSSTTCMYSPPFYDEEGKYHDHDPNTSSTSYSCSNNHTWSDSSRSSCWCGWPGEPTVPDGILVSDGLTVNIVPKEDPNA